MQRRKKKNTKTLCSFFRRASLRSRRIKARIAKVNPRGKSPNYYGEWIAIANSDLGEPATVKEALSGSDKIRWQEAMRNEMKSIQARQQNVWDLVELPKDKKAIGSKRVFKLKTNTDGSVERYKTRIVAQGFSQKFGSDYDETFIGSIRRVMQLER